ncbi:MAG: hypothetical protein IKM03_00135 [Alistipes sp.]|nr:hypothetical protein [Alistipes sp.]
MTNPFITIWTIIKRIATGFEAKTWQTIALSIGLVCMVWSFVCIHQIKRIELSYHIDEIRGLTKEGNAELNIHINNGLLFEQDSIPRDNIILTTQYDTTYNHRIRQNIVGSKADSTMRAIAPNEPFDSIAHLYKITTRTKDFKRVLIHKLSPQYEIPSISFREQTLWAVLDNPTIEKIQAQIFNYLYIDTSTGYVGCKNESEFRFSVLHSMESINAYPSIWNTWDISQKSYRLQYTTDSDPFSKTYANGKPIPDNKLLPLGNLKVDFMGPVELLPMSPEPDIVSMSGFEFTDSLKLQQIMRDGLEFHAKFPQTESLQSARIFFLTTFISLFFTLLCTLGYRIIRHKLRKSRDSKPAPKQE